MGTVNRKNNCRVSLGLKALLGFGFYDRWARVTKNNAKSRITFIQLLSHLRLLDSEKKNPAGPVFPPHLITHKWSAIPSAKYNRKRCVGRTPATPGSSRDASSRPRPRPPKAAARRMLTAASVPSPVRPAADPRQDPDPGSPPSSPPAAALRLPTIPARLCLQAASRSPTPKCFPAAARQQDPITQGSSPRGPVPPAGGAGGRAGPDLLLILLFPMQPLSQAWSLPCSSQGRKGCVQLKLSLGTYQSWASYQQLPRIREFLRNNAFQK